MLYFEEILGKNLYTLRKCQYPNFEDHWCLKIEKKTYTSKFVFLYYTNENMTFKLKIEEGSKQAGQIGHWVREKLYLKIKYVNAWDIA